MAVSIARLVESAATQIRTAGTTDDARRGVDRREPIWIRATIRFSGSRRGHRLGGAAVGRIDATASPGSDA